MAIEFDYSGKVCVPGKEETGGSARAEAKAYEQTVAHTCGDGTVDSYQLVDRLLSTEGGQLCMKFTAHITCREVIHPKTEKAPPQKGR